MSGEAIGLVETRGQVSQNVASDAMLKSANVKLVSQVSIGDGYVTTMVTGDVGSVRAAVDTGAEVASQIGELRSAHLISRPADGLVDLFI